MKRYFNTVIIFAITLLTMGCAARKSQGTLLQEQKVTCESPLGTFDIEILPDPNKFTSYIFRVTTLSVPSIRGGFYVAFALANSTPEIVELDRGTVTANKIAFEGSLTRDDYERYPLFVIARVYSASDDISAGTGQYDKICDMPSLEAQ